MNFDKVVAGNSLRFVSAVTSGLFAGGALYINIVESPARSTHNPREAVVIWRPSFTRAKRYLGKMALISGVSGIAVYSLSNSSCPMTWLLAGSSMLPIPPFTMLFIARTNDELLDEKHCEQLSDEGLEEKLAVWNRRHAVRSLIALGAFTYMTWLISKGK